MISTPLGSNDAKIEPAVRSSCAEIGTDQDDRGRTQSRSAAAGIAVAADGGVFSPRPRYCLVPADGGAERSSANERGDTDVLMSRSRPNHLIPRKSNSAS